MSEIAGRTVLITGGASGVGRRVALRLASLGGRVVLWDINREALDRALGEVTGAGGGRQAAGYLCDIADREGVYATAARVQREVGAVDILINNAGIVSGKSFLELPDAQIEATFKINALALFWTGKAFLPAMIERNHGHIVTMGSASGYIGVAKLTDYAASKWAAVGFDESLRVELRRRAPGVVTTIVCPYYIDTGMFRGVKTRFPLLLPILDEQTVADRIVRAIQRNRRRLVLPRLVGLVPLMRLLPVPLFDAVANFLGVNASMDDFAGRDRGRSAPA
jgi:all-trans-retinol dehydrogenase (NAD+)